MGWKDRAVKVDESPKKSSWKDRALAVEIAPPESPETSPITAATTSLMEGAVPFAGALAGAGKAGMDAITGVRGPLAGGSIDDVVDDYMHARDEFTGASKTARGANPGIALAGNVAGGIANPLFKGLDSLPKAMGAGAIQGLGMSEADLAKGNMKGAAIDAGVGAAGGALGYGVGKAIPKVWEGTKYFGKKALTNLGPSAEAIEARLAGKASDTAKSYPELAEDMGETLKSLGKRTKELSQEAGQHLSDEANIPKQTVTHTLDEAIQGLGLQGKTIGPVDKQVSNTLSSLKGDLDQLSDNISEKDLKGLIKKMDDNINWDDQSQDKLNTILEGIRTDLDQALKFRNSGYKKAMVPVAEQTRLLENMRRQFNLKGTPGKGLVPTDATASKIQASLRDNKAVTEADLKRLAEITGKDYSELANDYRLSQQFQKTGAQGSKRTNIGAAIGAGVGGIAGGLTGAGAGSALGSLAGGSMDAFGGKLAGKLIDSYLKAGNSAAFGKFAPVIEKAAAKGPDALAMLASILGSNPEFQKEVGIPEEEPMAKRVLSGGPDRVKVIDPKGNVRLIPKNQVNAAIAAGGRLAE